MIILCTYLATGAYNFETKNKNLKIIKYLFFVLPAGKKTKSNDSPRIDMFYNFWHGSGKKNFTVRRERSRALP